MPDQLEKDIEFVYKRNPPVHRLIKLRGQDFAHKNSGLIADGEKLKKEHLPTFGDFEELLTKGLEIGNRYLNLFKGATWSTKMPGDDDYLFVLNALREQQAAYVEKDKALLKSFHRKPIK